MRVGAIQSNYLPWKGYFDLIRKSDKVLVLDHLKYTKNDWRNRNQISQKDKLIWITIPVRVRSKQSIASVQLPSGPWRNKHVNSLKHAYGWSKNFKLIEENIIYPIYDSKISTLSDLNVRIIKLITNNILGLNIEFIRINHFEELPTKSERLAHALLENGCSKYISGPRARNYLDESYFNEMGMEIEYMDYEYAPYQTHGRKYFNNISIADGIAHMGNNLARVFERKVI